MEYTSLGRFAVALVFVLGLIGICAIIARKVMREKNWLKKLATAGRIEVRETLYLDPRHKLVLVRRDDTEHLLLIGSNGNSLVVESPIVKGSQSDA